MSETNELERLRANLATVEAAQEIYLRDYRGCDHAAMVLVMKSRIAKLEAEADPWAEAKRVVNRWLHQPPTPDAENVARLVIHLESENAAKAERIAELEARPIPPLNPKTVIATACKVIAKDEPIFASVVMQNFQVGNAGIYPLEGEDEK